MHTDTHVSSHDSDVVTEYVVNTLVEHEDSPYGATAGSIAATLQLSRWRVLKELQALEAIGLVYRTGAKRGTRWWSA